MTVNLSELVSPEAETIFTSTLTEMLRTLCLYPLLGFQHLRENAAGGIQIPSVYGLYKGGQPFNDNMLRPCPMLENPERLKAMVQKSGAHSTDLQSPENVENLCAKCKPYAQNWTDTANKLWSHFCKCKENTK